jgi:hypothetical protein
MPNSLKKALARPQSGHLLYARTLNFGFLWALIIKAFFANAVLLLFIS